MDLYGHGLKIVRRPISNFLPLEDGRYLKSYPDAERTRREFARISEHDAAQLQEYGDTIGRLADVLRKFVLETPPNSGGGLRDLWALLKAGKRLYGIDLETSGRRKEIS